MFTHTTELVGDIEKDIKDKFPDVTDIELEGYFKPKGKGKLK